MMRSYYCRDISSSWYSDIKFAYGKIKKLLLLNIITTLFHAALVIVIAVYNNTSTLKSFMVVGIEILFNSLLVQSWVPMVKIAQSLNGVSWYLSIALFLYMMFPKIKLFLKKSPAKKQVAIAVLIIIVQFGFSLMTKNVVLLDNSFYTWSIYCFPIYRLGEFTIGCISYLLHKSMRKVKIGSYHMLEILLVFLCMFVVASDKGHISVLPLWINYSVLYLLLSVSIIILFVERKGVITRICDNPFFRYLGDISGNMFLIHYVLIYYVATFCHVIKFGNSMFEKICILLAEFVLSVLLSEIWKMRFQNKKVICN